MSQGTRIGIALVLGIASGWAGGSDASAASKKDEGKLLRGGSERSSEIKRIALKDRTAVRLATRWLLDHQEPNGSWDADEFMKHDPERDRCTGPGLPEHDEGLTALALMALMSGIELKNGSDEREAVEKGLSWLVSRQEKTSGLLGQSIGHAYLYGHALATTALCEGIAVLGQDELTEPAQKAVTCIQNARNPAAGWRYELPPVGDNDTSVTALMITALATARDVGLVVDPACFAGGLAWIDEVTKADNGRVGYDSAGSVSSRVPGINDHFPANTTESMTAAGLFVRLVCGQRPETEPVISKHCTLIMEKLPGEHPDSIGCDMYSWYHGSVAIHQIGGKSWKAWKKALSKALGESQEKRGSAKGSWEPDGPWGFSGGRVCSTAIAVLCLTAPVRHRSLLD